MFRAITWCAKCLFLYALVAVLSIKFAWIFVLPTWAVATKFHWTTQNRLVFLLSAFLPIFAAAGFLLGLLPFGRLGKAVTEIAPGLARFVEPDPIPPIYWAWLPVTVAFLIRFLTWQSRNASVLGGNNTSGRIARFFGTLNAQTPALLDPRWAQDRFLLTGPMLFLMACAIAVLLRHTLSRKPAAVSPEVSEP
ncbi:hypothetical protein [Edaphobacter aggregans]|uniref:hypothetical protein n=1 Tax=Edaphobacter aggregans TaxID=570835 RepID=UPI000552720B|nr:hypothetical protein [Edaphobacter aggregans]